MPRSANAPSFRLDIAGFGALDVLSFTGTEAINQVYGFDLNVRSHHPNRNLCGLLLRTAHMALGQPGEGVHGVILAVRAQPVDGHWQLHLGPRLACLAWRRQPRIFQDMNVIQILAHVLGEHGIGERARRFDLSVAYPAQAFCVQQGESDLDFVQRLCSCAGLRYHFQHARGAHLLVFSDGRGRLRRTARGFYRAPSGRPGVQAFTVQVGADEPRPRGRSGQLARGESDLLQLRCGTLLPLSAHPRREWNHLWLLTLVEHHGDLQAASVYRNRFQAVAWEVAPVSGQPGIPPSLPGMYRARIEGPQPNREYRDERGRIAVRFEALVSPSWCWLQVCPRLPGARLLLPGSSVLVRFVQGDPQRPLVVAVLDPALPEVARTAVAVMAPSRRLHMHFDWAGLMGPAREIQLADGPRLQFEPGVRMHFGVGDSHVHWVDEVLQFSSPKLAFEARAPRPVAVSSGVDRRLSPQGRADLLELLRAGHPLVLLCRKPGGGSFSHCRDAVCTCRAAASDHSHGES